MAEGGITVRKIKVLKTRELELGDVVAPVSHNGGRVLPFDTAIVLEKTIGSVKLYRPFARVVSDSRSESMYEMGDHVACTVSAEVYSVSLDGKSEGADGSGSTTVGWFLLQRNKKGKK